MLSLSMTSSIDSDMVSVIQLFDNLFIDDNILFKKCNDFNADSGYRNNINIEFLTKKGFNTIFEYNKKKSINKNINVTEIEVNTYQS